MKDPILLIEQFKLILGKLHDDWPAKPSFENLKLLLNLIQEGASPNITDDKELHISPLMWAAYCGNIKFVRDFIGHHASIEQKDKDGWPALYYAIINDQISTFKYLYPYHKSINLEKINFLTKQYNSTEIIKFLDGVNNFKKNSIIINDPVKEYEIPLLSHPMDASSIKALNNIKSNINYKENDLKAILEHWKYYWPNIPKTQEYFSVKILLNKESFYHMQDSNKGMTFSMWASYIGDESWIDYIINSNFKESLFLKDKDQWRSLEYSARAGHSVIFFKIWELLENKIISSLLFNQILLGFNTKLLKFALTQTIDVTNFLYNPIFLAIEIEHIKALKIFYNSSVFSINDLSLQGKTTMEYALHHKKYFSLAFLQSLRGELPSKNLVLKLGASLLKKLQEPQNYIKEQLFFKIKTLYEWGLDSVLYDNFQRNFLLWAGYYNDLELVKFLLEKQYSIEHKDIEEKTIEDYALQTKATLVLNFIKTLKKTHSKEY